MIKIEYNRCEKLIEEAIQKAKQAQKEYKDYEKFGRIGNNIKAETEQIKADQHYNEAIGINHVLVALGFEHDRMKELYNLI